MGNTIYSNFVLANEVEDQFNSHIDLQNFFKVDNSLVGTAGMIKKIHVYSATNGTQKLAMGYGNTDTIEVSYAEKDYTITLAQNRFKYYDEQEMTDPMLVPTGTRHMGTDMFNTVNADIYGELAKATMVVVCTDFDFDCFADAEAMLGGETGDGYQTFAFVSPADTAELRKALKGTLQYVEAYARNGYIGTVANCNIYTKKDATTGTIEFATSEAVTVFNKKGTEIEQERDANTRENTIYSRKYYLAALTDETKAVTIVKGTATLSEDTTVDSDKTYYEASGTGYIAVVPEDSDNPATEGWYEIA